MNRVNSLQWKVKSKYKISIAQKEEVQAGLKDIIKKGILTLILLNPEVGAARVDDPHKFGEGMEKLAHDKLDLDDVEVTTVPIENRPGKRQVIKWTIRNEDTNETAFITYTDGVGCTFTLHTKGKYPQGFNPPSVPSYEGMGPTLFQTYIQDWAETLNQIAKRSKSGRD